MYRGDRAYSAWWGRVRIGSSVGAALSFSVLFVLALLKMDGHSSVSSWSWKSLAIPPLAALLFFLLVYCGVHYYTRHTAFTYTSDAAASYLLGIRPRALDDYHSQWVFRDILLCVSFALLTVIGFTIAALTCRCNTPYGLLSVGGAIIYFLRFVHAIYQQVAGWGRLRLMIQEVSKFQEFLDQHRLFNHVLPDLYSKSKQAHKWLTCFLFCAVMILAALGSIWVSNKNCATTCSATYISSKYYLYGIYSVEFFYLLSELYLVYLQRVSGVGVLESLIDRLENENRSEKRKQFQLLQAERKKRNADSTSTR